MKTKSPVESCRLPVARRKRAACKTFNPGRAFTLIELLVVISIIGILAAFTLTVLPAFKRQQYIQTAKAELGQIQTALENYKAQYGFYPPGNQLSASATYPPALFSHLYYELSGTKIATVGGVDYFVSLDGSSRIRVADVNTAYGVGGFINCTKGNGEDAASARNFLPGLKPNRISNSVTNNLVTTTELVTSVGGPDDSYQPLGGSGLNPIRYVYPGTNNPNSYDLWVQLVYRGQTNLVCNWNRQVQINSPLP